MGVCMQLCREPLQLGYANILQVSPISMTSNRRRFPRWYTLIFLLLRKKEINNDIFGVLFHV